MIQKQKSFFLLRLVSDLALLNLSFIAATILAQSFGTLIERNYIFILLIMLNIAWYFSANAAGFYEDYHIRDFPSLFMSLLKSTFIQALTSIVFIFIAKEDLFTRYFILYHSLFLVFLISLRTIIFRKAVKFLRKNSRYLKNLLVVGPWEIASRFSKLIDNSNLLGYCLAGYITEDNVQANDKGLCLGGLDSMTNVIESSRIDEVIIALPSSDSARLDSIIRICNKNGLRTHIIPDYFNFLSTRFSVGNIGGLPIITVRQEPLEQSHSRFIKRSFDILFSLIVILMVLSWMLPLIVFFQKLLSPGPVFFLQERIGKNNKRFKCFKFRSMKVEKEPMKFVPASENDPRITPFGKMLRKTNIDELPQFFNVLKGDMSIVGPRPHAIAYNEIYKEYVEYIKLRHLVKPGITGWAQVNGFRGDVADPEEQEMRTKKRIEHDLWYIENWSFGLDTQIIFMTIWQMLRRYNTGV